MAANTRRGFLARAFDGLVEARMRQANHYVNGTLLMLDDATLKAHGYDREALKRTGGIQSIF